MKDENKTKAELIKELKTLRKERGKSALNDITERKKAEETVQVSEEKYRALYENAPLSYQSLNEDGSFIDVNTAWLRTLGYNREEVIGKRFADFLHPDWKPHFEKNFPEFKRRGHVHDVQFKIKHKDGHYLDILFEGCIGYDPDDRFKQAYCGFQDITERKQAEEALRESEEKYRFLYDNAMVGIGISDSTGKILAANKTMCKITGYTSEELSRVRLAETYINPENRKEIIEKLKKDGKVENYELQLYNKNKEKYWVNLSTKPIGFENQEAILTTVIDITERKQAEGSLWESEAKYRAVLEQSADNIFLVDLETKKILESNVSLRNLLGYSADEMKKLTIYDFVARPKDEIKKKLEQLQKEDKAVIRERKYLRKDGSLVDVEMVRNLITFGNKKVLCVVARDISERKKAEERLKKTMDATIETMSKMIEAKDPYTSGHQHRVCQLAVPLAQELGLSEDKVEGIRIASLIHDIGRIGLPTEILNRPGKLNDIEFGLIKGHSQIGYDILKSIDFSYPIAQIVIQHHERLNGSGYPNNLRGDKIILEARIVGVADVVEAMSSHRPYRPALGIDAVLEEISKNRGTLYDPEVVDACLKLFEEKGFKFK